MTPREADALSAGFAEGRKAEREAVRSSALLSSASDSSERAESTLSLLREALERAIDGEHPEGIKKHKCVTITCEGQPREPTRPESFEFCEGVMAMAYEVHRILSAIFDEPKEAEK